jgi:hypothetical protein
MNEQDRDLYANLVRLRGLLTNSISILERKPPPDLRFDWKTAQASRAAGVAMHQAMAEEQAIITAETDKRQAECAVHGIPAPCPYCPVVPGWGHPEFVDEDKQEPRLAALEARMALLEAALVEHIGRD